MEQRHMEPYQGTFLSIVLCFGGLSAVSAIGSKLGHGVWLLMLPVTLGGLALFFFYAALLRRCGERDLAQLNMQAFGNRGGKVVLAVYLAYFLFVTSYFLLAAIDVWMLMGMNRTPFVVYTVLALVLCLLIARMGLAAIGRAVGFFVIYYFLMSLVDTLLLWPELSWQRLLPLSVGDWPRLAEDSLYMLALVFGLLPQALLFLPRLQQEKRRKKSLALGIGFVLAELLMINLRNVFLFGDALQFEDYPTYQALRLMEWGSGVLRLELFGMLAGLSLALWFGALSFSNMGRLLNTVSGIPSRRLFLPLGLAAGVLMCYIKSRISFIDDPALLMILMIGGTVILILLFAAMLMLQKCDCQKDNNKL